MFCFVYIGKHATNSISFKPFDTKLCKKVTMNKHCSVIMHQKMYNEAKLFFSLNSYHTKSIEPRHILKTEQQGAL